MNINDYLCVKNYTDVVDWPNTISQYLISLYHIFIFEGFRIPRFTNETILSKIYNSMNQRHLTNPWSLLVTKGFEKQLTM